MAWLATARFPAPPAEPSQPRIVGPGAGVDDDRLAPAPPATIARAGALPQPILVSDTSCRPSVVRPRWSVEVHRRLMGRLVRTGQALVTFVTAAPLAPRERLYQGIGPPPALPREGERVPLHPRCLQSSDGVSVRRPAASSTCCPQPVARVQRRLCVPYRSRSLDEVYGMVGARPCSV